MYYDHREYYDGDNTICGPITYTVSWAFQDGTPIDLTETFIVEYSKNSYDTTFGQREIKIDFRSYPLPAFETTIVVTITGGLSGGFSGALDDTFTITLYDCTQEEQVVPTSPDIYAYAGNTESYQLESSEWTQDSRCFPLTLTFQIEDPDSIGTWLPITSADSWITSFTQVTNSNPYSYTASFKELSNTVMFSHSLKNRSVNKDGKVNEQADSWVIHFFEALPTLNDIWTFPLTNSDDNNVFSFSKQDSSTYVTTNVAYTSSNTNVALKVYFLEYTGTLAIPYYSITEDLSDADTAWKTITLDPSAWASTSVFLDPLKRKVIPNYTGLAVPSTSDSRWIDDLTLDLTIEMVDCTVDFAVPAENKSMLD
jgi:hypothetical protein